MVNKVQKEEGHETEHADAGVEAVHASNGPESSGWLLGLGLGCSSSLFGLFAGGRSNDRRRRGDLLSWHVVKDLGNDGVKVSVEKVGESDGCCYTAMTSALVVVT